MDLEGIARVLPEDMARQKILELLSIYKGNNTLNEKLVDIIIKEVRNSEKVQYFKPTLCGIKAGNAGLGSRGIGDHLIHLKLFEISKRKLSTFDDAGISEDTIVSVDGIHSRLSYFPFLAGFHATKATLRDIMVKGAKPLGLIIDIHVSDDTDISYLFDFEAGVSTVADALGIPILAGSTLRIGGDMVIGERISGGVGSVGKIGKKILLRSNIRKGMKILMTKGNGGGTVATTAIYNGMPEIINETLKIDDILTARKINTEFIDKVDAMTDVTNGGIRGDALEISEMSNLSFVIDQEKFFSLINKKVLDMFSMLGIDPFGVSIDSLLIFTEDENLEKELNKEGLEVKTIGYVDEYKGYPILTLEGKKLEPNFRESPYTPIKKIIGNYSPYTLDEIKISLEKAYNSALAKKAEVLKNLKVTST